MIKYFRNIGKGRIFLWCYVIWYLVMLFFHFDPSPRIWFTSIGLSFVIGVALILSVSPNSGKMEKNHWQTMRLFLMPFCVSSYSALVKGKGFLLIFSPDMTQNAIALGFCLFFVSSVILLKWTGKRDVQNAELNTEATGRN